MNKLILNEQFKRMQKIAGLLTENEETSEMMEEENQINEESYSPNRMLELIQMYVDNYSDEGMSAEAAIRKIDELLQGNLDGYDIAFLKGEEDSY